MDFQVPDAPIVTDSMRRVAPRGLLLWCRAACYLGSFCPRVLQVHVVHPLCIHLLPPVSFSNPLRHFTFSLGFIPPRMTHTMIKSTGASTVFRAAKARKSSRDYPGAMLHGAIADIVKLAPCWKGYNRWEAPLFLSITQED